ncbi:hypothetical protein [Mycoplasma capricolum]|uniref:hypothetical protein n=1 Tax=Mycoplasma capricolum TaxID=2095 RepID=UPI0020C5140F|nr:hypothetical protein [Mycoplasma capricolum]
MQNHLDFKFTFDDLFILIKQNKNHNLQAYEIIEKFNSVLNQFKNPEHKQKFIKAIKEIVIQTNISDQVEWFWHLVWNAICKITNLTTLYKVIDLAMLFNWYNTNNLDKLTKYFNLTFDQYLDKNKIVEVKKVKNWIRLEEEINQQNSWFIKNFSSSDIDIVLNSKNNEYVLMEFFDEYNWITVYSKEELLNVFKLDLLLSYERTY